MYKDIIKIKIGDLTKIQEVDVIVNAANNYLEMGGGVCGAIFRAAGAEELSKECKLLGGCKTGEAKITKGYNLPNNYIIHTVGPKYRMEKEENTKLASAYYNSLKLAKENNLRKIAFPSIATGIYRYPIKEASEIAFKTAIKFLEDFPNSFDLILWVLDEKTFEIYKIKYEELIK